MGKILAFPGWLLLSFQPLRGRYARTGWGNPVEKFSGIRVKKDFQGMGTVDLLGEESKDKSQSIRVLMIAISKSAPRPI